MRLVPYQEILSKKIERQKELLTKGASMHANGCAFHIGKVSMGCRDCFTGEASINIFIGSKCMCKCPYCYYDPDRTDEDIYASLAKEVDFTCYKLKEFDNYRPGVVSFCSAGETLLYIEGMENVAARIYPLLYKKKIRPYTYVYTNGILADDAMLERLSRIGVNELRFHLSASDFSQNVLDKMKRAKARGMLVTVEEPSLPSSREKLFELLPIFNEIGISHLDLIEPRLTAENIEAMKELFPGDGYLAYKDYFYHLYDGGMVYDIMEEVIDKGYTFSVIDCNSGVERCRACQDQDIMFDWQSVEGMCREFNLGEGFRARMKNGKEYRK